MHEIFEHTADLGIRIQAATLEELFAEAAQGLLFVLVTNGDEVRPLKQKSINLQSEQLDFLLFDWLAELVYIFDTEKLLLSQFDVQLENNSLQAVCHGEPMDQSRHEMDHEIKAITYHGLSVEKTADGYLAEVIVDI